jgi:hypothetical protein
VDITNVYRLHLANTILRRTPPLSARNNTLEDITLIMVITTVNHSSSNSTTITDETTAAIEAAIAIEVATETLDIGTTVNTATIETIEMVGTIENLGTAAIEIITETTDRRNSNSNNNSNSSSNNTIHNSTNINNTRNSTETIDDLQESIGIVILAAMAEAGIATVIVGAATVRITTQAVAVVDVMTVLPLSECKFCVNSE